MTGVKDDDRRDAALKLALKLVVEAMDLIDGFDGPPDASAHLELARERLHSYSLRLSRAKADLKRLPQPPL
jgi:hypothetical protein